MASALVSLADAVDFLGEEDEQQGPIIERLIDQVEALFLTQCNRRERPFAAAASARTETLDGTGTPLLFLDYPIASLTSVKIGANVAAPVETLAVADVTVLRYAPGRAKLHRVDGGRFGCAGEPRVVHVTYDTLDDLPADAAVAILRVMAAVYRQRGSEDVKSERAAGYSGDLATVAESDPMWTLAVRAHWTPVFA